MIVRSIETLIHYRRDLHCAESSQNKMTEIKKYAIKLILSKIMRESHTVSSTENTHLITHARDRFLRMFIYRKPTSMADYATGRRRSPNPPTSRKPTPA